MSNKKAVGFLLPTAFFKTIEQYINP
jgi:hypothetical protein